MCYSIYYGLEVIVSKFFFKYWGTILGIILRGGNVIDGDCSLILFLDLNY